MMEQHVYICAKCGHQKFTSGELHASGSALASVFDYEDGEFITISCASCGYTELYRSETSTGKTILDFLTN
ncbi:MAG: zinc ribbon domain-containing protein [Deferribacteraceae bacterium]|jgi:predicted nucleic-acid-binding Zn-ribbon protein|nr:zinc ribbon domain-containing protein [Deferribacteraceae bacterium]